MVRYGRRSLSLGAICVVLLIFGAGREVTPAFDDPPDAIVIKPPGRRFRDRLVCRSGQRHR